MIGFLYTTIPAVAGAIGWYGVTTFLGQTEPISEHADWVIGIMGAIITLCLAIIGWFLSRFHKSIEKNISEIKEDIEHVRCDVETIGKQVAVNTAAIALNTKNRRR